MAISATTVASVFTSGNATSYATGSYTPTASRLMVCSICSELSGIPDITGVTGNGLTWELIAEYQADTSGTQNLIAIYAAFSGGSPSAGAVTVSYGAVTQSGGSVIIDEYDGCDLSGTVAACFVQTKTGTVNGSGTSETITLTSAITGGNASGGVFQHQADETSSNGSGYNILGNGSHSGPSSSLFTEYKAAGSTTVDASWTTSAGRGGIAFELKAAGGTAYMQDVSGANTPAGAVSKQAAKSPAGTQTPAGTISKVSAKSFSGTVTSLGDLLKQTGKILSGALSSAGSLLAGAIYGRINAGTLTSAGALVNQINKVLSGTLTSAGTLLRSISKTLVGTLTDGGSLEKQTNKPLTGAVTPAGGLSTIKSFTQTVSGALASAGALINQVNKVVSGTLTSAGTLLKSISKTLAGTLTDGGSLEKQTSKPLIGAVTSTGGLSTIKSFTQTMSGTLNSGGTLDLAISIAYAGSLGSAGTLSTTYTTGGGPVVPAPTMDYSDLFFGERERAEDTSPRFNPTLRERQKREEEEILIL